MKYCYFRLRDKDWHLIK